MDALAAAVDGVGVGAGAAARAVGMQVQGGKPQRVRQAQR
jgi:hypothetical protein